MTDNDKCCPPPKEVQDFLFKQSSVNQVCEEFQNIPSNSSLIAADEKRGLLYTGYENKLIIVKPENSSSPEWKYEVTLEDRICQIALSCDCSLLAVTFNRSSALIYDTNSINKHTLNLLHKIRLSANGLDVIVKDLKWNPAIPEILCSVTSDHTIACFQVSKDKTSGVQIIGMEKSPGFEALCVSWSPKGKQIVVGCKNGDIIQLKPELKLARHLSAPNPNVGMIISILWVSNYQFCACYFHPSEQRISVMIVDAPKGVTVPRLTNYEDVTFGSGPIDNICYYFEHITEWGLIIAASTHSSEVAVLGTSDNGASWSLWQLMDDSTAQLPLNRKKKIENYPVGMAVDKCTTEKLLWGPENTLPNPVPILRILVTSGQLCNFHMVNLKENAVAICTPPTEFISAPQLPRPSIGPSEVSFNLSTGATSTPRSKQNMTEAHVDKPKLTTQTFGNSSNSVFSFLAPGNRAPQPTTSQIEVQNIGLLESAEVKTITNVDQGSGKTNLLQQDKTHKVVAAQADEQMKKNKQISQSGNMQAEANSIGLQVKYDNKIEFKNRVVTSPNQTEPKSNKEIVKEPGQQHSEEAKSTIREAPVYDDGICLRAYYDEQARFEKELKGRLDLPTWNCGTEEERKVLVRKSNEIDEFLRELRETTNSLASDIAYLKALLLQSFAWIEETKSKNSASSSTNSRSRIEGNKLADLQRLYYYTQSQLVQATKVLDLEWAEHNDLKLSRMKIPSLEMIYQSLIRYTQIIDKEKKTIDELTKKWRSIGRDNNIINNLDRSMASLDLSQSSITQPNDTAINLRCKLIATNTRNLSREKQTKLRDLLSESAPMIVRAVRPTAVQDRLEATLSSLASLKSAEASSKASKPTKSAASKLPADHTKLHSQNSLSSLNNLVSGIGTTASPLSRSPSSVAPFTSFALKSLQPKSKDSMSQQQPQSALGIPKAATQSTKESLSPAKPSVNSPPVAIASATNNFPSFTTFKSTNSFSTSATPAAATPSFASVPKLDASIPFKFPTKSIEQQQTSNPPEALDFSGLSFNARPSPVSSLFAKSPPAVATTLCKVSSSPTIIGSGSLPSSTSILPLSSNMTAVTSSMTAPAFGTASMFGTLSSPSTPPLTFKLAPTSTTATTGKSLTGTIATTTCAATISFPGISSSSSSVASSFSGILGSTASLNFGSSTTGTSITPAFSKSSAAPVSNIFGSTPTSIFGKSDSSVSTAAPTTKSTSIFGNTVATASGSLTFGNQTTLGSTSENSFFGSKVTTSTAPSVLIFEGSATPAPTNSIFGNSSANANLSTFAAADTTTSKSNVNNATPSSGTSIFGGGATSGSGISAFGSSGTTQSSGTSVFGTASTTQNSGSVIFGSSTTQSSSTSIFGSSSTTQSSGTTGFFSASTTQNSGTSVFGNSVTTQSNGASVFGGNSATPSSTSVFGGTNATIASPLFRPAVSTTTTTVSTATTTAGTTPVMFGTPASPGTGSIFSGGTAAVTASVFSPSTTPSTSIFGAATSQPATGLFGTGTTSAGSSVFGTPATMGAGSSIFGGGTSAMGTGMASPSVFGQSSAFGAKPVFGSPAADFGAAKPGFTTGFSSPTSFGASSGAVFGSPSLLGTGSPLAGTSPNKVFGSNTFETPGAQSGGLSFDSLAQKTTSPEAEKPQEFQSSSSFLQWR